MHIISYLLQFLLSYVKVPDYTTRDTNLNFFLQLIKTVGKVEVTKPKINYLKYEPKEPDMNMQGE